MDVRSIRGSLVLLMAITVPACGPDEPVAPPGIFFPTVPIGDAYPSALMEGVLEERAGCLFVTADQDHWLFVRPVAPTGAARARVAAVLPHPAHTHRPRVAHPTR